MNQETAFHCSLCPRNCSALRTPDFGNGYCHQGSSPKIARAALHFWEEPCISGEQGSGAVFFSGCTLGCIFCQNDPISHGGVGKIVTEQRLEEIFDELVSQGANNLNLVSATPYVSVLERIFSRKSYPVPVVWNSSGYETPETLERLSSFVDIYLPDLKYISADLSAQYSGAPDYFQHASKAIVEMCRQTGTPVYDKNGLMKKGTIIRHLILPSHPEESIQILRWIHETIPSDVPVSIMAQYLPFGKAKENPKLNRRITKKEYDLVLDELFELDLDGYVQDRSSSKEEYIPSFDLTGV